MSVRPDQGAFNTHGADQQIARLERAFNRERRARLNAESIAERGLRESYLARSRLELLNRVSDVANESNDPLATLQIAAKEICLVTGWAIGTILMRVGDPGDERLQGTNLWYAHDPDRMFAFAEASQRLIAWPCASPPGRLFIDHHPIWTPDLQALPSFSRADVAARAHLVAGVAAPVLIGKELVAVIEFFATDAVTPDPEMLELLVKIGAQAGRVFKRERHAQRLIESATRDALTGLPNRTLFDMRLNEIFSASRTADDRQLSVIYIDLDGFKLVNDTMGHQAGDQLLIAMTESLRKVTEAKAMDNPDATIILARMGGDEFTVLVNAPAHIIIAKQLADDIHDCLEPSYCINGMDLHAAASIGIAHDDATYESPEALMRDADIAMYEAKYQGKVGGASRTVAFDATMRAEALDRLELESALRQALELQCFELHYQPIVRLDGCEIVGFEALLRWPRADGSFTSPEVFVPLAEECGLIVPIGTWVIREACRTAARWRALVAGRRAFFISLNVAPLQLQQPNFCGLVRSIMIETGAHAENLAIELTEGAAVLNPVHTGRVLDDLRAMGIHISIDDFGTGYSSLSHIQSMPFDALKIDRSFIMSQEQSNANWTIVNAMLKLAEAMSINVIAEGVETQFQRDQLREFGCMFGQGWLFSRAVPASQALTFLQEWTD